MADGSEVPLRDETDWARVDAMTDEEFARAVADDPDAAPLLSDGQLVRMRVDLACRHRRDPAPAQFRDAVQLCAWISAI